MLRPLVAACLTLTSILDACTAFQLRARDSTLLYGRSLEFALPLDSAILIVPRGAHFQGSAPTGAIATQWDVKYGYVGMNQNFAPNLVSDGMNEEGFVVGALYLPDFASYQAAGPQSSQKALAAWEVPSLLLGSCKSVREAKELLASLLVAQVPPPGIAGLLLPLHFYLADASGAVAVIEYVDGARREYDNPLGILTNSPPFDWQLLNLRNYINLSPMNVEVLNLGKMKLKPLGQGSGLLGLPGDFSPASRFVRAAFFTQSALTPLNGIEGVRLAFHLLNTFDIFEGAIQSSGQGAPPYLRKRGLEKTQWAIVHDQTHLKSYVRMYEGLLIERVDFDQIDFKRGELRQIAPTRDFQTVGVSEKASPLN